MLLNILSNAVKYTQQGGEISLDVREVSRSGHSYVKYAFVVKDNGIGMTEEFQKHLFDVFTRAEDSVTNKVQGTGLGMAISKSIVENVMVLSKLKEAKHIDIHVDMSELDVTKVEAESSATYEEIKAYVQEHFGVKVSALNIAQVKRKYGIIERECYNKAKAEDARQPRCPEEKEKAIEEAMRLSLIHI